MFYSAHHLTVFYSFSILIFLDSREESSSCRLRLHLRRLPPLRYILAVDAFIEVLKGEITSLRVRKHLSQPIADGLRFNASFTHLTTIVGSD